MGVTNFPGGISSFGIPVLPGITPSTGSVFFVCNATGANGSDGAAGTRPDQPLASLTKAIALCTDSKFDTIFVMPGHVETVIAAGTITVNKIGVRIIGLGSGRLRPTINYTTAVGASFDVTAANVHIENLVFTPIGFDAITAAINVTAADCEIVSCDMQHANVTNQATLGILTSAAGTRLTVQGCRFYGTTDAGTNAAIRIVGGDGHVLRDNTFSGAYASGTGPIENVTTACTNTTVDGNRIQNFTAGCTKAMVFVATSTGQVSNNRMQILSGAAPVTGVAMSFVGGNYHAAAVATAGTLL